MTERKGFFKNVIDAMVEGRERSVRREIEQYRKAMRIKPSDVL